MPAHKHPSPLLRMPEQTSACMLAFLLALACAQAAFAQAPRASSLDPLKKLLHFTHEIWQEEQGLPQNVVQALAQTADGYLWLGMEEGLARFDGARFTVFNKSNTPALRHNNVWCLLAARNGDLWIGTRGGGLTLLRGNGFTYFSRAEGLAHDFVLALHEDVRGNLWIGTEGGLQLFENGAFKTFTTKEGLGHNTVLALGSDAANQLWIGTESGLSILSNQEKFLAPSALPKLARGAVTAIARDSTNNIWLATAAGLVKVEKGMRVISATDNALAQQTIQTLRVDRGNNLWLGSAGRGLSRYANGHFENFSTREGLSSDFVRALHEDHEGSMWIGTYGAGLNRLSEGKFTAYSKTLGLNSEFVWCVYEDRRGALWLGTDKGLHRYANGQVEIFTTQEGLSHDVVLTLLETRDGALWIGTEGGGLNRWQNGSFTHFTTSNGLAHNVVRALCEDRRGALWIGTNEGVNVWREGGMQVYRKAEGLTDDRIYSLYEDRRGRMWLGTGQGGLLCFENGKFTAFTTREGLSSNFVRPIYEDEEGTLWIGTRGGGLNRFKDGKFTSCTTAQGLFDDVVFQILPDASGNLWMSCNKGVFRVSKSLLNDFAEGKIAKITCTAFGKADGMKSHECNGGSQPAGWRMRNGTLLFPTVRGVAAIAPEAMRMNTLPPPVVIESLRAADSVYAAKQALRLAPGMGTFEIHYTGLSFVAPSLVRFKYKLEGYEEEWIEAGNRRAAYYTNLPPGDYVFRVQACNNDGVWNEAGAALSFQLAPFFYQTKWFYLLCFAALLVAARAGLRFRERYMRERAHELALLVEERTRALQQEIEERKRAEAKMRAASDVLEVRVQERTAALRESEERWLFALEGNGDGVWDWNAQTDKVFFSKRWKEMLGYEEHEVGEGLEEWSSRVHPEDLDATVALVQKHLRGETPVYISEHRVRCKDGSYKWILDRGRVLTRSAEGQALRVVGTHSDITARKEAERALQESETKLHTVMERVPDAIVMIARGKIIYTNSALTEKLGVSPAEILGQSPLAFMHKEDHARATADMEALAREGVERAAEYRLVSKDGAIIHIEAYSRVIQYGGARALLGVLRDVSERKVAEAERAQQQNLLQSILNNMTDGLIVADTAGKFLVFNQAAKTIAGLGQLDISPEEWAARYGCYMPDQVTPFATEQLPLVRAMRGEEVEPVEMFLRNEGTGEGRWLNLAGRPLRDAQGAVAGGLIVFNDDTARKQTELALQESEERFRQFAETIQEVFWMTDPAKNQMLYVSPAYEKITGRTATSLYANPRDWLDAIHPDDRERVLQAALTKQILGEYDETYRIKHLDGTQRWLRDRAFPVRNAQGKVYRIAGIAEDVTAQKLAQEQLAKLKSFYETVIDQLPLQIAIFDSAGRYIYINASSVKNPEVRQWMIGKTTMEYCRYRNVPLAIGERRKAAFEQCIAADALVSFEEEMTSPTQGGQHYLVRNYFPLREPDGSVERVLGFSYDLTAQKEIELALRESEARFHAIVEATPIPMVITRVRDGAILYANKKFGEAFRLPEAQAVGRHALEFYSHSEDRQRLLQELQAHDYVSNFEVEVKRADGSLFWVVISVQKLLMQGEPTILVGFYDITARKAAEEQVRRLNEELERRVQARTRELQDSEERLRQIAENIDEVLWIESREDQSLLYVSPNYEKIWGRTPESLLERPEQFMESVFREDREAVRAHLQKQRRGEYSELEYRILHPNGALRWVRDRSFPIQDQNGAIYRTAGMGEDVTARKQTEAAEHARNERLQRQQAALLRLAQTDNSDLESARKKFLEAAAQTLEVERVSYWSFVEAPRGILCEDLFRLFAQTHESGVRLLAQDYPRYFEALGQNRAIAAHEAQSDSRTADFTANYLKPLGITSMLDVPIWFHGQVVGIICHEHTGASRVWTTDEQEFASSMADLHTLALEAAERIRAEQALRRSEEQLRQYAERLESLVAQRAERIQELERQRSEIEKLAAAGRLAARIAHEINNPLGGIKNSFLLVKDAITPEHPYFHYVGRIEKEIDRIARIVRQMFQLNKPDQELSRPFKIEETIREIMLILEPSRREHGAQFEFESGELDLLVTMPEGLLRQILFNLIQNAIEASPPTGVVKVNVVLEKEKLHLAVADQGVGIPAEISQRIFEPFFTTKSGLLNTGLGLGLSVCKNIVDALKGTITFENGAGKGTVFKVELPITTRERE